MLHLEEIIIRPLLTEKMSVLSEKDNRYGFQVALKANKFQIKSAIEKLFDVRVLDVKTIRVPGKVKRLRKNLVKLPAKKKAYIKIKEGQKIELFKGI